MGQVNQSWVIFKNVSDEKDDDTRGGRGGISNLITNDGKIMEEMPRQNEKKGGRGFEGENMGFH